MKIEEIAKDIREINNKEQLCIYMIDWFIDLLNHDLGHDETAREISKELEKGKSVIKELNINEITHTGLKDRNGKEIYKGNIVKGIDKLTGIKIKGEVTFKDGSFCIYDEEGEMYHFRWMDYDVEVVDNVYENP